MIALAGADRDTCGILQISRLRGGELRVQHEHRGTCATRTIGHRLRAARAEQRARVRCGEVIDLLSDDAPTLVLYQRHDLRQLRGAHLRIPLRTEGHDVASTRFGAVRRARCLPSTPIFEQPFELSLISERNLGML